MNQHTLVTLTIVAAWIPMFLVVLGFTPSVALAGDPPSCEAVRDFQNYQLKVVLEGNVRTVARWGFGKRSTWRKPVEGQVLAQIDAQKIEANAREREVTRMLQVLNHKEVYVLLDDGTGVRCGLGLSDEQEPLWNSVISSQLGKEAYPRSDKFPYSQPLEFEWDPGDQQRHFALRVDFFDFVYRGTKNLGHNTNGELHAFEGTDHDVAADLVSLDFVIFDGSRKMRVESGLTFPTNHGRSWLQEYEVDHPGSWWKRLFPRASGVTLGFNASESKTVNDVSEFIINIKFGAFIDLSDAIGIEAGLVTAFAGSGDYKNRDDTAGYVAARVKPEIFAELFFKSIVDFWKHSFN